MGVSWEEQARVQQLLTEAVMVLCKNSLKYRSKFCIEGLFGITIDDSDILLVNIKDGVTGGMGASPGMASGSPAMNRMPNFNGRSPMGMAGGRMAFTSPRRGRAKTTVTRGRSPQIGNRKRALFSSPQRMGQQTVMRQMTPPQHSLAMPLPDQSGLSEGPPIKMRRPSEAKQEPINPDDVIEIGDEDETVVAPNTKPEKIESGTVKQEIPDLPSSSTDQSTKFTLDGESNKSLTDFLDNLMSQHDVGHGGAGAHDNLVPKSEPNPQFEQGSSYPHLASQPGVSFSSPQHSQKLIIPGLTTPSFRSPKSKHRLSKDNSEDSSCGFGFVNKTFHCLFCDKVFASHASLNKHGFKVHERNKNYQCHLCQKKFVHPSTLSMHIKTHDGIYPYPCKYCDKGFTSRGNMQGHVASVHTGQTLFHCTYCNVGFNHKQAMKIHLEKKHPGLQSAVDD